MVFQRAPLGRRGVDEDQVRQALHRVGRELELVMGERTSLAAEVSRLRSHVAEGRPGGALPAQEAHFQAVRILSQAQQTADLYVADAERYSREMAQEARQHRQEILSDARSRAELMMEEAHQKAAAAAHAAVSATPAPAPSSGAPGEADERRRAMEREIAYLRSYSDVYRTHLRSYLESLLNNIQEWERSERTALEGPPPAKPAGE